MIGGRNVVLEKNGSSHLALRKKIFGSKRSAAGTILVIVVFVYYSWLLWTNLCDVAGGSDSSGYLNFAWRLGHERLVEPIRALSEFGLSEEFATAFRPIG